MHKQEVAGYEPGKVQSEVPDISTLYNTVERALSKAYDITNLLENSANRAFGYRGQDINSDILATKEPDMQPLSDMLIKLERQIDRIMDQARRF